MSNHCVMQNDKDVFLHNVHACTRNDRLHAATLTNYIIFNCFVCVQVSVAHTPPDCPALRGNAYEFVYVCSMPGEAAALGAISLLLTILNIFCIFIMGIIFLKVSRCTVLCTQVCSVVVWPGLLSSCMARFAQSVKCLLRNVCQKKSLARQVYEPTRLPSNGLRQAMYTMASRLALLISSMLCTWE